MNDFLKRFRELGNQLNKSQVQEVDAFIKNFLDAHSISINAIDGEIVFLKNTKQMVVSIWKLSESSVFQSKIFPETVAVPLPEPLENPDWSGLIEQVKDYIEYVDSSEYCEDNDRDYYIFEAAVEAVYGSDIWDKWINIKLK